MARWRHELFDATVAVVLVTVGLIDLFTGALGGVFPHSRWIHLPFVIGMSVPVAFRRRWPLATLIVIALIESAWIFGLYPIDQQPPLEPFVALLIAVYSAAAYAEGRAARAAWVTVGLGVLSDIPSLVAGKPVGTVAGPDVTLLIAFSLGVGFARSRRRAEGHARRAAQAERDAARAAERAVAEERARIARELHDVISHDVSVMVVQAAVERRAVGSDSSMTAQTLESIESTGREALAELRRMLGVLRKPGERAPLEPQPGLGQMPELVARVSDLGVSVRVVVDGQPRELPHGIDLAAYRIVQESLTNIVKHAPGSPAQVTVRYEPAALDLTVCNPVSGECRPVISSGGHGLVGMRERVAVYGGQFESGLVANRGFRVHARLPLAAP